MQRSFVTLIIYTGAICLFAQDPTISPVSNSAEDVVTGTDVPMADTGTEEEDTVSLSRVDLYTAGVDPASIRSDDGLVIWPVPAADMLHIYCGGSSPGNMPFEIVNMTGRVVLRGFIQGGSANLIEVDDLAAGDHLLRVVDGRGMRQVVFNRIP